MKKNLFLVIVSIIILACGGDSGGDGPVIQPPVNEKPVAVNDTATGVEDTELILSDLLSNDTVITGARITSIDATSSKDGTIVDNRNGTYSYNPPTGFVGEDTFNYILCDNDPSPDCSTATVTITVTDEGTPIASDDAINGIENQSITINDILNNDTLTDDAVLTSVDNTNTTGSITLNADKSITYTPQNDFVGDDTFTYSICDDDENPTCVTATVTISVLERIAFNIPSELSSYYEDLAFTLDEDINYNQLQIHTEDKHTTILSYGERHNYLYDADEDASNTANVILMYSGESRDEREYTSGNNAHSPQTFNTEHIYPQSRLESDDAVTDLHHLRSADAAVNSLRSNYPFVDGSGAYQLINDNTWYPGDDWRGDVARMVMYLNVRYGETFEKVGTLELFLQWNISDPVSTFEIQRNNVIQGAQGNRNPFIDNPYLATLIWGGENAENKWN